MCASKRTVVLVLLVSFVLSCSFHLQGNPENTGSSSSSPRKRDRDTSKHRETLPAHDGTRVLESGELSVEVADPQADTPYDTGVRFAPVGLVLRARYRGHSFFWSPTPPNQYSSEASGDPGGTIMEFDIGDATLTPDFKPPEFQNEFDPPGYREADPASKDPFLKIGEGILQRHRDGGYSFCSKLEAGRASDNDRRLVRK